MSRNLLLKQTDRLFVLLQVPRPLAMKKEGIQTRKRKPKNLNKSQSGELTAFNRLHN